MIDRAKDLAAQGYARLPPLGQRFAKYALCGLCAVTLDFASYSVLVWGGINYQLANLVSTILGLSLSFVLNRAFTFQVFDAPLRRAATFFAVGFVGYVLGSLVLHVAVEELHINAFIAKVAALVVAVAAQFTLNSVVTFRSTRSTTSV
jgi:putative flippase GtrA